MRGINVKLKIEDHRGFELFTYKAVVPSIAQLIEILQYKFGIDGNRKNYSKKV